MTTFIQGCNDAHIANVAVMSSNRLPYSVITFTPGQKATTSYHKTYGLANTAFRSADNNTHLYNNMLKMCVRKK